MTTYHPAHKGPLPAAEPPARAPPASPGLGSIMDMLTQIAEDNTLPKNVRRGAQGAWEELARESVAEDLRISSAVGILDDLANDVNLPVHGRTSIWSVISRLESLS